MPRSNSSSSPLLPPWDDGPSDGFLPVKCARCRCTQGTGRLVAHARVLETSSGAVEGDVDIVADDGTLLVEIRGLHAKHLESAGEEPIANWLYELRWRSTSDDADGVEAPAVDEWLLVGGDPKIAQELASALEAEGASCTVVRASRNGSTKRSKADALRAGRGRLSRRAGRSRHRRSLRRPARGLRRFACAARFGSSQPRWRRTARARAASSSSPPERNTPQRLTSPRGSPSRRSALGRVIGHELPRALPPDRPPAGFSKGDLSALAAELLTTVPEEEIALRDDQRYVRPCPARAGRASSRRCAPPPRRSVPRGDRHPGDARKASAWRRSAARSPGPDRWRSRSSWRASTSATSCSPWGFSQLALGAS